ncbi:MAG: cell division ATP-binding protein FtsE [Planktomarina sp.]
MIEFENVSYSYGDAKLFDDVSASLPEGSFHFLTGPSGSGKTTLIKQCYADLSPTSGTVRIAGQDTRNLDRDDVAMLRRKVGVVHQDCQFLDHLTVAENVSLPLIIGGHGAADLDDNMNQLLAWVGLQHVAGSLPPSLSGGERQRAALARALIAGPDIILADEPTGNVDAEMSKRLMQLLIELNKMGKTVLMATHDLSLIRTTKGQVQARVLRIQNKRLWLAGADL